MGRLERVEVSRWKEHTSKKNIKSAAWGAQGGLATASGGLDVGRVAHWRI